MSSKNLLAPELDPMGRAIWERYFNGSAGELVVLADDFDEDPMDVELFFREMDNMNHIERLALERAHGRILDVGAAAGCHSLALEQMQKEVTAIDISPLSVEVAQKRGLTKAMAMDFYDPTLEVHGKFDTILMLMNGTGIIGTLENIGNFFVRLDALLSEGGEVLVDSSDLRYLYEAEDGSLEIDLNDDYYGQMRYTMSYRGGKTDTQGEEFDWLYIDFDTLDYYASQYGFSGELIASDEHYHYLASLKRSTPDQP